MLTSLSHLRVALALIAAVVVGILAAEGAHAQKIGSTGALYLHYSDNGPPITDLDGEALVAIGEPWVLDQFSTELAVPGEFPFMDPLLPIPCPIP